MTLPRHIFVLMLENRSFDHFFGQSGLPGVPPPDATKWSVTANATDRIRKDLGHELHDVSAEMATVSGVPMMGFETMKPSPADTMAEFSAGALPVVRELARQFVLFDNWFSSMPGPTWPNRFFVHAGSSGGLTNSPSDFTSLLAVNISSLEFKFANGTIFERLVREQKKWRVYYEGMFPQVLSVQGMIKNRSDSRLFRDLNVGSTSDPFATDLNGSYDVDYTFLEPNHGIPFGNGDSQHAPFSVAKGERLIKYVYETLRASPIWPDSALLVTWDEHGGFFDHVVPPQAAAPGDAPVNHGREKVKPSTFGFGQLGVRVPALLISPFVPKGVLGTTLFPNASFDHTSVISSLQQLFQMTGGPLTNRDAAAPSFVGAFQAQQRADCPLKLPDAQVAAQTMAAFSNDAVPALEPLPSDSAVDGYLLIARALDVSMTDQGLIPQSIASEHPALVRHTMTLQRLAPNEPVPALSVEEKLNYMQHVAEALGKTKS